MTNTIRTAEEVVDKVIFDNYWEFTKAHYTDSDEDLLDAYMAVEALGAVLAHALGIQRIQTDIGDEVTDE